MTTRSGLFDCAAAGPASSRASRGTKSERRSMAFSFRQWQRGACAQVEVASTADVKPTQPTLWVWYGRRITRRHGFRKSGALTCSSHTIAPAKPGCGSMTTIKSIFFDIGDTLGIPAFSPPPAGSFASTCFSSWRSCSAPCPIEACGSASYRTPAISTARAWTRSLNAAGIRDFFDPALRLYSKDVGLEKNSPEIFRVAAERAGLAATPQACLFVGENETERGFASDAGLRTCPHPLLVSGVLGDGGS